MGQNGLDFAKLIKATLLLQRSPGPGGTDFHPSVKEGGDLEAYGGQGRERDVPTRSAGGSPLRIRLPARSPPEASPLLAGLWKILLPTRICAVGCAGKFQQSISVGNLLSGWPSCDLVPMWCSCSIPKHSRSARAEAFLASSPHWF